MAIWLNPPDHGGTWPRWTAFYYYCLKQITYKESVYFSRPEKFFQDLNVILKRDFNGKIVTKNGGTTLSHLEFEKEEDMIIFKLKFN